jgi:hypothetical protein
MNDRWIAEATIDPKIGADAATTEAFINSLRGGANTVNVMHFQRLRPNGTQFSSTTLQTATNQGANSFVLVSTTGLTLLEGDLFTLDGLLLQVAEDCTAVSNLLTVTTLNRARRACAAGSVAVFNQPTIRMRLVDLPTLSYQAGGVLSATSLMLAEDLL